MSKRSLYQMYIAGGRANGKSYTLARIITEYIKNNPPVIPPLDVKPIIKKVIFNEPATIVFWEDGTKTVVKCREGDEFDPEKGLAMAVTKKALGNKYDYYNQIKHWLKKYKSKYITHSLFDEEE